MKLELLSDWLDRKVHITYMENENILSLYLQKQRFFLNDVLGCVADYNQRHSVLLHFLIYMCVRISAIYCHSSAS